MRSYLADELPALLAAELPLRRGALGILGHSMGGHGALVLALHHPDRFRSSPPSRRSATRPPCPWGIKAFTPTSARRGTPGRTTTPASWSPPVAASPAPCSSTRATPTSFLGDPTNSADEPNQLRPDSLVAACAATDQPLTLRRQPGYDHSYYFISTFLGEHLAFHAALLADVR
jgi:S-formylglutathione hydrolase